MLWKSVGNWQPSRTVDLRNWGDIGLSKEKPGNYPDEQADETLLLLLLLLLNEVGNARLGESD